MAVSEVSICSNALRRLGDKAIASFTESDVRASRCADLWPTVRDDILRAKLWNCAKKRVLLAPLTEEPAFDWTYQFQKPSDWIRTVRVGYDGQDTLFRDEGGKYLADINPLPVTYIFRNTNCATYDSALVSVLELAMAAQLAYAVTQSQAVADTCLAQLEKALRRAGALSSNDDGPEDIGAFDLLASRFRSRSTDTIY